MKPHIHADLIKAWADGETIQVMHTWSKGWVDTYKPSWDDGASYRIKPNEPKTYEHECHLNLVMTVVRDGVFFKIKEVKLNE